MLALIVGIVTAYALARLDFRFKRLVLTGIIATSMFPVVSIAIPLLKLFVGFGWINTYQAMVVPSMSFALPLAVWNLTAFFRQMPESSRSRRGSTAARRPGVPQGDPAARRTRRVHHRDPHLRHGLERVPDRRDDGQQAG